MSKNKKSIYLLLLIPLLTLVILFEILPIVTVFYNGFKPVDGTGFTLDNFKKIFLNPYYFLSIKNSIYITFVSSLIGIIASFLASYSIYVGPNRRIKKMFINLLNLTSNFQGIQLAFAFMILLGNSGILVIIGKTLNIGFLANYNLYSISGIILAYVFFQIPLGTLLLYPSFSSIKKEYIESASLLGVTKIKFWFYIGIPILFPSIIGTFSVLFANALAAYATPYALMGNNVSLLSIRISNMFTGDLVQQKELGSAMSIVMITIMVFTTYLSSKLLTKNKKKVK